MNLRALLQMIGMTRHEIEHLPKGEVGGEVEVAAYAPNHHRGGGMGAYRRWRKVRNRMARESRRRNRA